MFSAIKVHEIIQFSTNKIQDRIVSLHMPFIRPIVRGKTNAGVEFGAKHAISIVNGFSYMDTLSLDVSMKERHYRNTQCSCRKPVGV